MPPGTDPGRVVARLGLLSDTHLPERLAALPPALFDVLRGVDLLLHAGDIGDLAVLDRLAAISRVVAVHGNDDSAEARRKLPLQQAITVGGRRILLYRGHNPDRARELAWRRDDAWGPKLARLARGGKRAGDSVVVSGHSHVPMAHVQDGVLLVNPGAPASPNARTRQRLRTVALLVLLREAEPVVAHVDLPGPDRPFAPRIDRDAGFRAAHAAVTDSILAPDLGDDRARLEASSQPASMAPAERDACRRALLRAARRCWSGERETIGRHDLLAELEREPALPPATGRRLRAILAPS